MSKFFYLGIMFGFAGFIIETIGFSFERRRFVYAGNKAFWGIPFLPVYAFGGLLMHAIMDSLQNSPWYWIILVAWLAVCSWEYFAGFFCYKILGKKYWNYSKQKYNLHGYVSVKNSFWWLVLVSLYFFVFFNPIAVIL